MVAGLPLLRPEEQVFAAMLPCRWFTPVFEQASQRHDDIVFGKVDTEAQQELAAGFGIMSIPTLMIIRDNVVLYAQPGALPEPALEDLRGYRPEAAAYDLVVVAYVQLAPAERAGVLGGAAAALAPRGTLLVVGHDLANLAEGVGGPRDPAVPYTVEAIVAELDGLTIRRAGRVRRPVDTAAESGEAVDTLVLATRD